MALLQIAIVGLILAFHAARFPYFFITLAPLLAIPGGLLLHQTLVALGRAHPLMSWAGLLGATLTLGVPFAQQHDELLSETSPKQHEGIRELQGLFPPETLAFDPHHTLIRQRQISAPMYARAVNRMKSHPQGPESFVKLLRERAPIYYVQGKRTEIMPELVKEHLETHFVRVTSNLYMAGVELEASGRFEILVPGRYRYGPPVKAGRSGWGPALIDGKPVKVGGVVDLEEGQHTLRWRGDQKARLRIDWPGLKELEAPRRPNRMLYRGYR